MNQAPAKNNVKRVCLFIASFALASTLFGIATAPLDDIINEVIERELQQEIANPPPHEKPVVTKKFAMKRQSQTLGNHPSAEKRSGNKRLAAQKSAIKKQIARLVKDESQRQLQQKQRRIARDRLAERAHLKDVGKKEDEDFFYKIPVWPFRAIFYAEKDLLEVDFTTLHASRSFSSNGHTQDLSRLVFGESTMRLKDIVLASKLLVEGKVDALAAEDIENNQSNEAHYLYILADQIFDLDAKMDRQALSFNYARHFHNGDVSFGFQLPIVRRKNRIKLLSKLTPETRSQLEAVGGVKFFDSYDDLEDFFKDILRRKDISFNRSDTELGIGDIRAFLNVEIHYRHIERLVVGASALFPTAKSRRNVHKLWDPVLGNDGFIEVTAFTSALFGQTRLFNPHVFIEGTVSVPADLQRRVPQRKSYDPKTSTFRPGDNVDGLIIFGEQVNYTEEGWREFDTFFRRFASQAITIRVRKGPEFFVRIGNLFDEIFGGRGSIDIFYDFRLKGTDYVGRRHTNRGFKSSILKHNTHQMEHRAGIQLLYPFGATSRIMGGIMYTFAGKNVIRALQGNISVDFEF